MIVETSVKPGTLGQAIIVPELTPSVLSPDARPIPLARPNAPKLSANVADLAGIEDSCRLSNYGPVNERLEQEMLKQIFGGRGGCVTACNATIGLILALKLVADRRRRRAGGFVLMPSFTFAAAAHAVIWAGLTPLLVDIDVNDWASNRQEEVQLLKRYGDRIAAVMPYATFGSCLDLEHYDRLSELFNVPVIIDAAASLGTLSEDGTPFGAGSAHTIVYSMHATKAFAVGEAGLIYSSNQDTIEQLRSMGNFGFNGMRSAVMAGLNSKISEVTALAALIKLRDYETQAWHRMHLAEVYRGALASCHHQSTRAARIPYQFMPVLLPIGLASQRDAIIAAAATCGIALGKYFSPPIHRQPYFKTLCLATESLAHTDDIANRMLSLPISDFMTVDDAHQVAVFIEQQIADRSCCAA